MPRNPPTLLTLPLELRLEIYTHLLVLPPPPPRRTQQTTYRCAYSSSPPQTTTTTTTTPSSQTQTQPDTNPKLHPQILLVNTQTNREATPLLYTQNTFAAHPVHLTAAPALYHPYSTPRHKAAIDAAAPARKRIKKWRVRVRLDSAPLWDRPAVAAAFSHADELTLEVWCGTFLGGVGVDVLRQFEGVRGVRRVKVAGMGGLPGFEGYVGWLVKRMRMGAEEGEGEGEDGEYVPVDETERRRLSGWV